MMKDSEYYNAVDEIMTEVMEQAGHLVFQDYALLNEMLIETSKRKKISKELNDNR